MKKLIPLLTAIIISVNPLTVCADGKQTFSETIDGNTFTYTVGADMKATIINCESYESEIIIPSSLGGYIVTSIAEKAFFGKIMMTSINIPEGITYIGDNAFSGCLSLESVKLPETLTYLGKGCFTSCTALENVTLNNMLSYIPDNCFNACTSLENINIPDSVVLIGTESFFGCTDLSGIFIPKTVKLIEENALGMHSNRNGGIEKINNFRIRGLPETTAKEYAEKNGIDFYCKLGDVNCDGLIDAVDSSLVLSEYASVSTTGLFSFDSYQKYVGDFNGDNIIDAVDATMILIEYARLQTLPYNT